MLSLVPCTLALAAASLGREAPTSVGSNETVTFALTLTRKRPHALAEAVAAVSDPRSARFRKYLSDEEISKLLEPTGVNQVEAWIERFSPSAQVRRMGHGSGQVLDVAAPAGEVSALLGIPLARFGRLIRADLRGAPRPPLPASVVPHIESCHGIYELPSPATTKPLHMAPRAEAREPDAATSCDFKGDIIDPTVLAKQYGWPPATRGSGSVSQGVAAFEDAEFKPTDVAAFEVAYSLPNVSFSIKGPNNGGFFGEAGLDTQYIVASGAGVPSWFLSQQAFDIRAWCETSLTVSPLPTVWSISWGGGESLYAYADQVAANDCFARAALKGVSVLAASGDDGTGSHGGLFGCKAFDPTYPASLPHVTAVGATYLRGSAETAWSFSGGGYSNLWGRPAWQDEAVAAYEATATLPPSSLYNTSGRVTPDVAAVGTCYQLFAGGEKSGTLSGTSAATPTFAGMVSRINDMLAAKGKPTVGFLNPLLYQSNRSVGTDIVAGNNKKRGCKAGFPAVVGFDAVSGLGTPLWDRLAQLLDADA